MGTQISSSPNWVLNSYDFSQYDDIQKKSRWQKITDEKQEELNFNEL